MRRDTRRLLLPTGLKQATILPVFFREKQGDLVVLCVTEVTTREKSY